MKKGLYIILAIIVLIIVGVIGLIMYNNKTFSTIVMDINPSIEINLNRNGKVLKVIPLNADANDIIVGDFKGKKLDDVVEVIIEKVIEKGYVNENEVVILLNTDGDIQTDSVEKIIEEKFVAKEVTCNIVVPSINDNANENAQKYGISTGKASYIDEIIEKNPELNFEDLKDKSIKELSSIINKPVTEESTEEPVEPVVTETPVEKPSVENKPSTNKPAQSYSNPPSDPTDTSGAWCTWNKNRPQNSTYQYDQMMDMNRATDIVLNHLNLNSYDTIGNYGGGMINSKSSYCQAYSYKITTKQYRWTVIIDPVTGKIIEESKEDVPTPKITEDEALKIFAQHFNLNVNDCKSCSSVFGTDMEGSSNYVYRYSVGLYMNDGTQHVGSVNALTGEIYSIPY